MKLKHLAIMLFLAVLCGCGGSGGAGLNGGITVTATATGSTINAIATYSNPNTANLIGVPITFSYQIGNQNISLGTHNTNNSGSIGVAFIPPAFNGTQTITVIASSANLTNFASLTMTGRSLTVTAPANLTLTTTAAVGSELSFIMPSAAAFVTITDPFNNDLSGHTIDISASFVSNNLADTFSYLTTTATNSGGTAVFPGANGTLIVPSVGSVESMTITWTVTDTVTGLNGTGVTTITLTKTS